MQKAEDLSHAEGTDSAKMSRWEVIFKETHKKFKKHGQQGIEKTAASDEADWPSQWEGLWNLELGGGHHQCQALNGTSGHGKEMG